MLQDYIYYFLLVICLAVSLYSKTARQNFFWLYFLLVLFYELFFYFKLIDLKIYATSAITYSLFFLNVYLRELKIKKYAVKLLLNIILIGIAILLLPRKEGYSISLGIMMAFTYILSGLIWLFSEFQNDKQSKIISKQFFWVSVSLLLWAVFFLFRLTPMYLFERIDSEFLSTLNNMFQLITIISYLIFFRGLLCKL